jgi:hypothetical protein
MGTRATILVSIGGDAGRWILGNSKFLGPVQRLIQVNRRRKTGGFDLTKHIKHGYNLSLRFMFSGRRYHYHSIGHNPVSIYLVHSRTSPMIFLALGARTASKHYEEK